MFAINRSQNRSLKNDTSTPTTTATNTITYSKTDRFLLIIHLYRIP
jgi:hypothetical protein